MIKAKLFSLKSYFGFISLASIVTNISPPVPNNNYKINSKIYGSLVANALTLDSHYEQDAESIKEDQDGVNTEQIYTGEQMGGSTRGMRRGRRNQHPRQNKGDQTDQGLNVVLSQEYYTELHQNENKNLHQEKLLNLWNKKFKQDLWGAWICTQTKKALQKYNSYLSNNRNKTLNQTPSFMSPLGGKSNAISIRTPRVYGGNEPLQQLIQASDDLMFTRSNISVLTGGEQFKSITHTTRVNSDQIDTIDSLISQMKKIIDDKNGQRKDFCLTQLQQGIKKYRKATEPLIHLQNKEFVDDLAATSVARDDFQMIQNQIGISYYISLFDYSKQTNQTTQYTVYQISTWIQLDLIISKLSGTDIKKLPTQDELIIIQDYINNHPVQYQVQCFAYQYVIQLIIELILYIFGIKIEISQIQDIEDIEEIEEIDENGHVEELQSDGIESSEQYFIIFDFQEVYDQIQKMAMIFQLV